MKITTTETMPVHLNTGEEQRLIYIESRDAYISLNDKTLIFYIEKGYIETTEDAILNTTVQRKRLLSRNILKVSLMEVAEGNVIEAMDAKVKEIVLQMISNNEDYLSGLSTYTFE